MATQQQKSPSPSDSNEPSQNLEKRSVVSSFIFKFPDGESGRPVVALFRRSEKVRTYRHHLAPISGNIDRSDKDPLAAAWREINEETTLTPTNLSLWRIGKAFTFSDPSIGREWTVHPFAFRLKDSVEGGQGEQAIHTDWEHEGWEWDDPTTVVDDEDFGGVPRLKESLRRVWFEYDMNDRAGKALAAGLKRLQEDHESGAHELTTLALTAFREFIVETRDGIDAKWWEIVRLAAWHLVKNGRESMGASTLNALLAVLVDIDEILRQEETDANHKWNRILSLIDFHLEHRNCHTAQVKDAFTSYTESTVLSAGEAREKVTILTLSASSTIRDSILDAYAALDIQNLEIRILESRPLFEGASFASSIVCKFKSHFQSSPNKKLHVKLYTDAAAALASQEVDMLLLGADRISSVHGVSNKTGSLPAVLSTKHVTPGVKVLVLSELEKIKPDDDVVDDKTTEENDPREIMRTWSNDGVKSAHVLEDRLAGAKLCEAEKFTIEVKNIYFEWVPLTLVDAFVSDQGVQDAASIREKALRLGEIENKYFGNL